MGVRAIYGTAGSAKTTKKTGSSRHWRIPECSKSQKDGAYQPHKERRELHMYATIIGYAAVMTRGPCEGARLQSAPAKHLDGYLSHFDPKGNHNDSQHGAKSLWILHTLSRALGCWRAQPRPLVSTRYYDSTSSNAGATDEPGMVHGMGEPAPGATRPESSIYIPRYKTLTTRLDEKSG